MLKSTGLKIYQEDTQSHYALEDFVIDSIQAKEIIIKVHYSGINYKDALAVTGKAKILRKSPLIGGIDLAGEVIESKSSHFNVGDNVLVNGNGLSEIIDGGFSTYAKVNESIVVMLPETLSTKQAMLIGTAGFTAGLAFRRMQHNGQQPNQGKIVVTGASGGVGSFAVHILNQQGYEVTAVSRKTDAHSYLMHLGATDIIDSIASISGDLAKAQWAGAIDSLGGLTLETLIKQIKPFGNVVSIGLAQSSKLETSVMPFIIRGINLLGVTSANCLMDVKREIWNEFGNQLMPTDELFSMVLSEEIGLSKIQSSQCFEKVLAGNIQGRVLINCEK